MSWAVALGNGNFDCLTKMSSVEQNVVAPTLIPNVRKTRQGDCLESQAKLDYIMSSRLV